MREQKWNSGWNYWPDKDAFALVWNVPEQAREVTLPHDAMAEEQARADSLNGGNTGYRDGAVYNYVKRFTAPEEYRERTVMLKFEGVYMNAMVYVNEQLAAKCPYGYTGFYVPLNDFLRYGRENEIRVVVRNGAMTNSRWYSGGGIYRDVYLLVSDLTYIEPDGVQMTTESTDGDYAVVRVTAEIKNRRYQPMKLQLHTILYDETGKQAASENTSLILFEQEGRKVTQRMTVERPALWSAEHPSLYTCCCRLYLEDGTDAGISVSAGTDAACCQKADSAAITLLDESVIRTGIRTLSVDAKRGLRVNGGTVKLRGACIHHDSGLLGAATYEEAEYRRVRILKEAGFNAVRMSHHPAAPALLLACDVLGMYVMDETFDMWNRCKSDYDYGLYFSEWWERDTQAMVRKDYNHPSVILYSVGNEIPEIGTDHGAKICHEICEKIRSLDTTRFTLAAINGVFAAGDRMGEIMADLMRGPAGACDDSVTDASGGSDGPVREGDSAVSPGEAVREGDSAKAGGEDEGPGGMPEGNVNDFMTMMDTQMDRIVVHRVISERLEAACASTDIAGYNYMTARYEKDGERYPNRVIVGSETYPPEIARNWELVKRLPHVIGDFTWTGWDYIGEAGVGVPAYRFGEGGFGAQFPCQLAYSGDIDITGFRRPASYFREVVFGLRKDPYITVQNPHHYGEKLMKTPWVISDSMSSWTYPGYEGKPVIVELYAPGDETELFCNGISLGKKPAGSAAGYRTLFETVYTPGTLRAVSYENGREIGSMELSTAGERRKLVLTAELPGSSAGKTGDIVDGRQCAESQEAVMSGMPELPGSVRQSVPGGKEQEMSEESSAEDGALVYVMIACQDEAGIVADDTELTLTAEIDGDAVMLGFGSGDPKTAYSYQGTKTKTFHGRAQLILKKNKKAPATVRIRAGELKEEIRL